MFRTIKIKVEYDETLYNTALEFNKACQIVLDYCIKNKCYNKNLVNSETYNKVRKEIPNLPSALVQTARDEATEMTKRMLKHDKQIKKIIKKRLSVRYDKRTFKLFPDTNRVSLTTIHGRLNYSFKPFEYLNKYKGEYTNAQLVVRNKTIFLNVQVKMPDIKSIKNENVKVLGIDTGIINISTCSDNTFYNSRHLRRIKGQYRYLRSKLQHLGTRSAKRKLKRLSGRERRFVRDVNHRISKEIVNKQYNVFAMEKLQSSKMRKKKNGKKFNTKLGSWSPKQLEEFIKYKSESLGKMVVFVNPKYTSQKCSKCGFTTKKNRKGNLFSCRNCRFSLNADLNASRNISILGKSEYTRLFVNQPIVTSLKDDSYKPINLLVGN